MRIFWWNGGLQVQPESDVETEAMLVLLDALKYERPPERDDPRTSGTPNVGSGEAEGGLDVRQ
jgi:hypothetical protein